MEEKERICGILPEEHSKTISEMCAAASRETSLTLQFYGTKTDSQIRKGRCFFILLSLSVLCEWMSLELHHVCLLRL